MKPEYGVRQLHCRMRNAALQRPHSIVFAALLLLAVSPAWAKPPELHPAPETPRDGAQMEAGQPYVFRVMYQDPDNDRPTDAALVAQGPSGTNRITPDLPRTGDFRAGVPL